MAKELSESIIDISKTRNKYLMLPSKENYVYYKNINNNNCNSLTKKAKKIFFKETTKEGIMSNKQFCSTAKTFSN